jgi:hypothetical protein
LDLYIAIDALLDLEFVFGPGGIVHDFGDALLHLVDDLLLGRAHLDFVIDDDIDLTIEFLGL